MNNNSPKAIIEARLRRSWRSDDRQGLSEPLAVVVVLLVVVVDDAIALT
jgi:hypothetical protein